MSTTALFHNGTQLSQGGTTDDAKEIKYKKGTTNEQTVESELDDLNTSVGTINTSIGTINTSIGTINTSISTINQNLAKSDISYSISSDIQSYSAFSAVKIGKLVIINGQFVKGSPYTSDGTKLLTVSEQYIPNEPRFTSGTISTFQGQPLGSVNVTMSTNGELIVYSPSSITNGYIVTFTTIYTI